MGSIDTVHNQKGQILVLSVLLLSLLSSLLLGLGQVSLAVRQKIRLQLSSDAAILTALNIEAGALNSVALINRAILANDALAAQLNAFVSESSFYRKMAEKFSRLLRLVPYAGPVSLLLSGGAFGLENIFRGIGSAVLPLARVSNRSLGLLQSSVWRFLPFCVLKRTRESLSLNSPGAKLTSSSYALLLRQVRSLQNVLRPLEKEEMERLRLETMDNHTRKRNWRINVGGFSPVKKTGGTGFRYGNAVAGDRLKLKVFTRSGFRWKTVLASRSLAKDFGYSPPEVLLSMRTEGEETFGSLGIVVHSGFPADASNSLSGKRILTATSAAKLVYHRASSTGEAPNAFNPFWDTAMIPVASEPSFRRMIPKPILEEIRH